MNKKMGAFLLGFVLASASWAADLPRLPKDLLLPQGDDSPGQVTFRHDSHVDLAKPACLTCHPRLFPILKEGQACGACHGKGKVAFDFEDACENCHGG